MKTTYLRLIPVLVLLVAACGKDLKKDPGLSPLTAKTSALANTAAPAWLVSKVTYTDLIMGNTSESVFSYNNANKPVREVKVSKTYNNKITRDTLLYAYNSAQQLIRYTHSARGSEAVFKYNAQGKLSAIDTYGELMAVNYTYVNDTVVLANFGVRWIDLKPRILAYAKVIYFIYDYSGNLRSRREFYKKTTLSDEIGITDTTGILPTVYAYGAYDNNAGVETARNIPGPGGIRLITDGYNNDEDFYPQFSANNILNASTAGERYDYIYNASGLPAEVTISWSSGPDSRYKVEYIPAK
jgi:YD repeat-containing protein